MEESEKTLSKRDRKRLNKQKGDDQPVAPSSSIPKKLSVVIAIVLLAFVAWRAITSSESEDSSTQTASTDPSSATEILETDYIYGNPDSEVVLIEYADFQCPACGAYYPVMNQLKAEFADKVAFIHRDFPLRSIHRNAQLAAQAAQAAGLQGKFWEMHDKLYENQETWSAVRSPQSDFESYAQEIGLDVEKFKSDIDSDVVKQIVNDSYNTAVSIGLNSTPSFLLNSEQIDNPRGYEPFRQLIEEKLSELGQASESAQIEE